MNEMESNPNWRGGKSLRAGRPATYLPSHPNTSDGYVFDYVLKAEAALGHYLPKAAVVHHVDCDATNDDNGNLVICENQAYHAFLHARMRGRCGQCGRFRDSKGRCSGCERRVK